MTLANGWTLFSGSFVAVGGVVVFSASFRKPSNLTRGETVFTIPEAYMPKGGGELGYPVLISNTYNTGRLIIDPSTGTAVIHTTEEGNRTSFDVSGMWAIR